MQTTLDGTDINCAFLGHQLSNFGIEYKLYSELMGSIKHKLYWRRYKLNPLISIIFQFWCKVYQWYSELMLGSIKHIQTTFGGSDINCTSSGHSFSSVDVEFMNNIQNWYLALQNIYKLHLMDQIYTVQPHFNIFPMLM